MRTSNLLFAAFCAAFAFALVGCTQAPPAATGTTGSTTTGGSTAEVSGNLNLDGSSTVTPIMEAMAEEFRAANPKANITVATSGTGGGFKKFLAKEIDISMASRPISDKELAEAKEKGIEFIEIPIAYDGLTVVVNKENTFVDSLTVAELKKIWEPDSKVTTWDQVRAGFPKQEIKLYGAGTDSGTFDYFTLAINGKEKASRTNYQASEDDNTLVTGVAGDKGSLGYFGFAYFKENADKLKVVKIDAGKGPVEPSEATIADASYQPLSRPLFIYINKAAVESNPIVAALVKFMFGEGNALIADAGYVALPKEANDAVLKHFEEKKTGTLFKGAEVGVTIQDVLSKEQAVK